MTQFTSHLFLPPAVVGLLRPSQVGAGPAYLFTLLFPQMLGKFLSAESHSLWQSPIYLSQGDFLTTTCLQAREQLLQPSCVCTLCTLPDVNALYLSTLAFSSSIYLIDLPTKKSFFPCLLLACHQVSLFLSWSRLGRGRNFGWNQTRNQSHLQARQRLVQ